MKKDNVTKFYASAQRLGFDREQAHTALGVKSLHEFSGNIGQALNILSKAHEATRAGRELAVLVLPEDERRALYPTDELAQRGAMLRAFAPFAHGSEPVTDQEIALVVLRADAMALDALNPHEVEVFKDKRGKINFMLSYVLEHQWIEEFHGGHLRPEYTPFTEDEKEQHGIPLVDKAMWCRFIMKRDIPLIAQMAEAGWTYEDARAEVTNVGHATVTRADWDATAHGKEFFAPNARDKQWKLNKRAFVDAVRSNFGDPSPRAIFQLRRARGEENIDAGDWEVANGEKATDARVRHAQAVAHARQQEPVDETAEETLKRNTTILHGEEDDQNGVLIRDEPEEPASEPEPEPFDPPRPWSPAILRERMERKIASFVTEQFAFERGKLPHFRGAVVNSLELCFAGEESSTTNRHRITNYLIGKGSSERWNSAETKALHLWLAARPDSTGEWYPSLISVQEAQSIVADDPNAEGNTRAELTQAWEELWAKAKLEVGLGTVALDDLPTTSPAMDNTEYTAQIEALTAILQEAKNVGS